MALGSTTATHGNARWGSPAPTRRRWSLLVGGLTVLTIGLNPIAPAIDIGLKSKELAAKDLELRVKSKELELKRIELRIKQAELEAARLATPPTTTRQPKPPRQTPPRRRPP